MKQTASRAIPTWLILGLYWIVLLAVSLVVMSGVPVKIQLQVLLAEAGILPLTAFLAVGLRRRLHQELQSISSRDELTGLASRAFFMKQVEDALARASRDNELIAVLFLDFDHFKRLNDTLGHAAGDRLLIEASRRLDRIVRRGELSARLGGDEFTFLLHGLRETASAGKVADRVLTMMERPFLIDGHEVLITASIGIALNDGPRCSANELVRRADVALYKAKAAGRNCWRFFDGKLAAPLIEQLDMGSELRAAVDRNELRLYFQPEIDLSSGSIRGFEALVRWQHPTRGLLSPAMFIPMAEESGVIRSLGRWVLQASCLEAVAWSNRFPELQLCSVSVNVSPSEFGARELVSEVQRVLAETGLQPARLKLEITETALMGDIEAAMTTMRELKGLGIKLSIDDFGSGYSSLNYLRQFPVDCLKIDQSFVREIGRDGKVKSIVEAIVALAHALDLDVTAEGIETRGQLRALVESQCDRGQGYLFAQPLSPEELVKFVMARSPSQHADSSPPVRSDRRLEMSRS
jgi:diguanylate cyclase (GGDEF)-like protein